MPEPETLSTRRFVKHFGNIDRNLKNRSFCFILGAGTSVTCGIPAAPALVDRWLGELYKMENPHDGEPTPTAVGTWATAACLNITGFAYDLRAEFYPQVYDARFRLDRDEGYAFVESVIEKKRPKFGYAVLAQVLSATRHRVVVTTNFDNLVADAMALYTRSYPLVVGHESLARYAHPHRLRRPLVAKIHRDWLLDPLSDPNSVGRLADAWAAALKALFQAYTPIVVGYAGNDGSLMTFLEQLDPQGGGMFWCYRDQSPPGERIHKLVERYRGQLVRILGFDELMAQLHSELELPLLHEDIESQGNVLAKEYHEHYKELRSRITALPSPGESPEATADRQETGAALDASAKTLPKKGWWWWQIEVDQEKDPEKADALYQRGLEEMPDSSELAGNYANFLTDVRKDHDGAERMYKMALHLDPGNAIKTGNYALFLTDIRKDHDGAERMFKKALHLDPGNADHTGNYAYYCLQMRRWSESLSLAAKAWVLYELYERRGQGSAHVVLYRGLIARAHDLPDNGALGRLHSLFQQGFTRSPGSFDGVLAAAHLHLSADDRELFRALADAVLDESRVAALDGFPRWKAVSPIPLGEPWPVEQLPPAPVTPPAPSGNGPLTAPPKARLKKK